MLTDLVQSHSPYPAGWIFVGGQVVPSTDKTDEGLLDRVGGCLLVTGHDGQRLDQTVVVVFEHVFGAAAVHVLPDSAIAQRPVAQTGHAPGLQERFAVRLHLRQPRLYIPISCFRHRLVREGQMVDMGRMKSAEQQKREPQVTPLSFLQRPPLAGASMYSRGVLTPRFLGTSSCESLQKTRCASRDSQRYLFPNRQIPKHATPTGGLHEDQQPGRRSFYPGPMVVSR